MSKLSAAPDVERVKPEDLARYTSIFLTQVAELVNGNLSFGDNFNSKTITFTFSAANTDVAVIHGLGRVPGGYFLVGSNAAMSIYDGASASTTSLLYLRSNAAGSARVMVY